ncbi:MAG: diguanylate cyclase, partial [Planctomycetota bacterium]
MTDGERSLISILEGLLDSAVRPQKEELTQALELACHSSVVRNLHNKEYCDRRLAQIISNIDESWYLFYGDVDGFKSVNSELGYDDADEVLRRVGKVIGSFSGEAFHRSGDEYAILCKESDKDKLFEEIEANCKSIVTRIRNEKDFVVSLTFGCINISHGMKSSDNIKHAEECLK